MTQTFAIKKPGKLLRITVADEATNELRRRILSGELADGTPVRQDALAEDFGTSRIPIREALSRLEAEGLVASYPHRGYVVTALSRDEIKELFELRATLEPALIEAAIPNMTENDFMVAEGILSEYASDLDNYDVHRWGELNTQYHLALYSASGRKRTIEIVRGLLVNTDRYTRVVITLDRGIEHAKEDHSGLLEYCRKGAINQAVALTRDHIQRAETGLLRMLDTQAV
jgi:DNA-binding GntR family transcriptional regulator